MPNEEIDAQGSTMSADALLDGTAEGFPSVWQPLAFEARYVIGGALGEGGMGEVFAARDRVVGRDVAVKRLRSGLDEAHVRSLTLRFLREARVQGRIEHPAVVPIYDVGLDAGGMPFLAMKRIDGETMAAVLERVKGEAASERRGLLSDLVQVCRALELAHRRSIVHRDVKPSNIMLGELGEVYLLDWGVARFGEEAQDDVRDLAVHVGTAYGAIVGTLGYMAPEQRRGEPVDARADVYAVGCVLREILEGSEAPPELDAIAARATAEDAVQRFASGSAIADAIDRYLDGDRDLAHRRALAEKHADAAEAVIAEGRDAEARASAMREAGRALALDPTCERAAAVASRLLLEPPEVTPEPVRAELDESRWAEQRNQARGSAINYAAFMCFVPAFYAAGVRSDVFPFLLGGVLLVAAIYAAWLSRRRSLSEPLMVPAMILDVMLVMLVTRILGVFFLAPVIATGATVLHVHNSPRMKPWIVALVMLSGLFVPLALELTSVLPASYTFEGGDILVSSSVLRLDQLPTLASLGFFFALNFVMVAMLTAAVRRRDAKSELQLRLMAWQLAQLAPRQR